MRCEPFTVSWVTPPSPAEPETIMLKRIYDNPENYDQAIRGTMLFLEREEKRLNPPPKKVTAKQKAKKAAKIKQATKTKPLGEKAVQRSSLEYREWRMKVLTRDDFTCTDCGRVGWRLEVHHIKPFKKFKALRVDVDNGITFCYDCHRKIHPNINDWGKQIYRNRRDCEWRHM